MRTHEYRTTSLARREDPVACVANTDWIQPGGRLVENQKSRPCEKGLREANALGQTLRERTEPVESASRQTRLLQHSLDVALQFRSA